LAPRPGYNGRTPSQGKFVMTDNDKVCPHPAAGDPDLPPIIDLEKVDFPSDALTIRTLRRAHVEEFDGTLGSKFFRHHGRWAADATIGLMIFIERFLATDAFEAALGLPRTADVCADDKEAHVEELEAFYTRYGLAEGPAAARELIRGIERQA